MKTAICKFEQASLSESSFKVSSLVKPKMEYLCLVFYEKFDFLTSKISIFYI